MSNQTRQHPPTWCELNYTAMPVGSLPLKDINLHDLSYTYINTQTPTNAEIMTTLPHKPTSHPPMSHLITSWVNYLLPCHASTFQYKNYVKWSTLSHWYLWSVRTPSSMPQDQFWQYKRGTSDVIGHSLYFAIVPFCLLQPPLGARATEVCTTCSKHLELLILAGESLVQQEHSDSYVSLTASIHLLLVS